MRLNANQYWDFPHNTKRVIDLEDVETLKQVNSLVTSKRQLCFAAAEMIGAATLFTLLRVLGSTTPLLTLGSFVLVATPFVPVAVLMKKKYSFYNAMAEKYKDRGLYDSALAKYHRRRGH
jgi:hypothetical protein